MEKNTLPPSWFSLHGPSGQRTNCHTHKVAHQFGVGHTSLHLKAFPFLVASFQVDGAAHCVHTVTGSGAPTVWMQQPALRQGRKKCHSHGKRWNALHSQQHGCYLAHPSVTLFFFNRKRSSLSRNKTSASFSSDNDAWHPVHFPKLVAHTHIIWIY